MSSPPPAFRHTDPDRLDLMLRVAAPMGWVVFGVLLCTVLGGLGWAVLATAPVKVAGNGVLQDSGGVVLVSAPASAPLSALMAGRGDSVREGAVLAVLADPVLDARIATVQARLARLAEEQARLVTFQAREAEVRARADAQRREGLEQTLGQAVQREATLAQLLHSQRELLGRGLATRDRVLLTESNREEARRDATEARNALNTLLVDTDERGIRAERERLEVENRINQGRQELAELAAERAARTEVRAPVSGRVIELAAAAGDRVAAGAALMRLVPEGRSMPGEGLVGILYVAPADGKKVRPGMAVQVVPSTARVERDGFILGEVVHVSEIPATREAVQQTLKNEAFVASLMAGGPAFEVRVALRRDVNTVSGFAWSSELGAARPVESGTVIKGGVVVERVRVMALLLPAFDALLDRLGIAP